MDKESFFEQVYEVVKEIPFGKVSTYGDIAKKIGFPNHSRLVGTALKYVFLKDIPCHRVVNSSGKTCSLFKNQRKLLEQENITFINDKVELKKYRHND